MNRAHQTVSRKKPTSLINFNYFTTIGINKLLYPYTVMPDLFFYIFEFPECQKTLENKFPKKNVRDLGNGFHRFSSNLLFFRVILYYLTLGETSLVLIPNFIINLNIVIMRYHLLRLNNTQKLCHRGVCLNCNVKMVLFHSIP